MATVSISPSPQNISMMSTRRVPLSSNPNAANSPFRPQATAAGKRSRSYSSVQRELPYGQPPPLKKQMMEVDQSVLRTPPRQQPSQVVFRKLANPQPGLFDRKSVTVRDRQMQQRGSKIDRTSRENLETIRQWQRHYRRVFPEYVFYFESIPEELRLKCSRQVLSLGAREEKFFSAEVTHVVTTRSIPPELDNVNSTDAGGSSSTVATSQVNQLRTINPSLLERSSESAPSQAQYPHHPPKGKFTFETSLGRKPQNQARLDAYVNNCYHSVLRLLTNIRLAHLNGAQEDARRQSGRNVDVLSRAREYGMKIWALEKLQRMMATMFDADPGVPQHGHNTRSNTTNVVVGVPKHSRNADLSNLLRNERLNGPLDRDPTVASKDLIPFKGVFIYVRDMKEKCRPIMVREYSKVANREEGQWPQFRSVSQGKCPFVEEVVHSRQRARIHVKEGCRGQEKESQGIPRTRAMAAVETANGTSKRILAEVENGASRVSRSAREAPPAKLFEPPKVVPAKRGSPPNAISGPHNTHTNHGGTPRYFGGEPIASGVQPSNITSAIRSQMISSTAAAPGVKAGTSKEIYGLQRKVLERTSQPPQNTNPQSLRVTDLASASTAEKVSVGERVPKRKLHEKLEVLDEEDASGSDEENIRNTEVTKRTSYRRKLHAEDAKPGYCENCKDKFDDFDKHTMSRKHRKFAVNKDNWSDLDAVLEKLGRPPKTEL
ncbi:hypothetical protein FGG08_005363 [Glutinoglossum americanum]|uniref:DBF4-type domain-containing protein n=1 Tax=Glutinoglossum americanum TaxID=1670608 RepID=A0A9P8I3D7_9PEZI|nr:hypothetical protein FGG08_005363 [Glutinoglossum americanum]